MTPQSETTKKTVEKKKRQQQDQPCAGTVPSPCAGSRRQPLRHGETASTNQTATSDALVNQLAALQKAQETQKPSWKGVIKQQAAALADADSKQEELTKQLDEVQQKVNHHFRYRCQNLAAFSG